MSFRWARAVAAVVAFGSSAGLIGWHVRAEAAAQQLALDLPAVVTPPPIFRKLGIALPAPTEQVTEAKLAALNRSLVADPLNARLLNLHYVQTADGKDAASAAREAVLLARLGWRDTLASQNLMLRSALTGDYALLLNEADALLRRERLQVAAFQFLGAVEVVPPMQPLLVDRLKRYVPWRAGFLGFDQLMADPRFQKARLATLAMLMRSGDTVSRTEAASLLKGLVASGSPAPAYALWRKVVGVPAEGLYDEHFATVASTTVGGDLQIPFEWRLNSDPGFSVSPAGHGDGGVDLQWDGRGLPVFISQVLPVRDGRSFFLEVDTDQPGELARSFVPSLSCGSQVVVFDAVATGTDSVRYKAAPLSSGCDFAAFALAARPLDDARPINLKLRRVHLSYGG